MGQQRNTRKFLWLRGTFWGAALRLSSNVTMEFEGEDQRTLTGLVRTLSGRLDFLMEGDSRAGGAAAAEEPRRRSASEDVSQIEVVMGRVLNAVASCSSVSCTAARTEMRQCCP